MLKFTETIKIIHFGFLNWNFNFQLTWKIIPFFINFECNRNFIKGGFMYKLLKVMFLLVFVAAFGLIVSSCSNKITQEQLMQLRELRKQQSSLTEAINKKRDEKARLERELNARKSELKDCEEKTQFVKDKLAKWPDVWPDWKYVEPTPTPTPAEAPQKKIRKK